MLKNVKMCSYYSLGTLLFWINITCKLLLFMTSIYFLCMYVSMKHCFTASAVCQGFAELATHTIILAPWFTGAYTTFEKWGQPSL